MTIEKMLAELNVAQRDAATMPCEHAMIIAGAGCGKTKTIISRAAYLIHQGVPPQRIQILTFTRRSASEIVHRVRSHLGDAANGLQASTFHSWCMNLIRMAPATFGCASHSVIDREDQLQIFKLSRGKAKESQLPRAAELCDLYSYARNTKRSLSAAIAKLNPELESQKDKIAEAMKTYETKKRERRYLDYDDILDVVAQRMQNSPETRDWVAHNFEHILVDEMQDTNPLQWELLSPLKEKSILFCVGDDAQSIYGFRGADFKNVHSFQERVPGAHILKLEQNYRSKQEILDVSNWLIGRSPLKYDKKLVAVRGKGSKPLLANFTSEWDEASWVSEDLIERHEAGAEWRDHMILVRSGFSGRTIEASLLKQEIPYIFIGGQKLLESAHIRDVMSMLRIVANPTDELAWIRYLMLWPGVGERTATTIVQKLAGIFEIDGCLELLKSESKLSNTTRELLEIVHQYQNDVERAFEKAVKGLTPLLEEKFKTQDWDKRKRDFVLVEKLASHHTTILGFIEEYMLDPIYASELEESNSNDRVTIITVHSAKGTEAPVCYIVDASPGAYPSTRSLGSEDEIEEERRVLYVALTRAKDEMIITRRSDSTWARRGFGSRDTTESYFFNNLPSKLVDETLRRRDRPFHSPPPPPGDDPFFVGIDFG
ncbi:ATP-dependent helicase [Pirellulaceae bacterium SH449]